MKKDYIKDIEQIKDIMNRSTRFISLSGLSGVSTGIFALAGAYIAYQTLFKHSDFQVYEAVELTGGVMGTMLAIALGTLIVSVISAIFFTRRQTKKQQLPAWDAQTKRLLINLLIPLAAGGVFALMLLLKGFVGMLPSVTLIFYGLALVNASKYSLSDIRSLGLIELVLGLLAFWLIGYGLLIWAIGFGLVQLVYGLLIQKKYSL
ncbi:MAG: hypothetical protein GX619_00895 [Bacteroidales bacterium]|nr:hypothetical protein [Bacteroidales bacterium]